MKKIDLFNLALLVGNIILWLLAYIHTFWIGFIFASIISLVVLIIYVGSLLWKT